MLQERWKELPVDKMVKADWNWRTDDADMMEKLKENLKRNGLVQNLIVRILPTGFYEVVNGNHRLEALRDIGVTEAMVFDLGEVSLASAQRIAVETNETNFGSDNVKLGSLMKELVSEYGLEDLSTTMPYNEKTIELMTELPNFSWDSYGGSSGEGKEPTGDEEFETFKVRLPAEVKVLLEEAIAKTRASITRVTKRPCIDEIRPIECIALIIREMSDAALAQCLS